MPTDVNYYECSFKCGLKHTRNVEYVIYHETVCLKNPESKACPTCRYFQTSQRTWTEAADEYYIPATKCRKKERLDLCDKLRHNCEDWEGK
jgi:hypothetical protein